MSALCRRLWGAEPSVAIDFVVLRDLQNQLFAAGFGVLPQRGNGRRVLAGGQGALKPGHGGCLCAHQLRHLGLRKPGFMAGLEQGIQQFALDALDLGLHAGAPHHLLHKLVMAAHV